MPGGRRPRLRERSRALAAAAAAVAAAAGLHRCRAPSVGFAPGWGAAAAAGDAAAAAAAAGRRAGAEAAAWPGPDLGQLLLADTEADFFVSGYSETGPDVIFYSWIFFFLLTVFYGLYLLTKPYWEERWLVERINKQKLKFITDEENTDARDKFVLGRMYIGLDDMPSALAEFEEAEEDMGNLRASLDPEDAMGALASRAMLHNSKGFSLMKLEPPRTAQARREFVRAVTYWPEYPEALLNIGRELLKRRRYDVAVRTLNTALKWQPGSDVILSAASEARGALEAENEDPEDDEYEYIEQEEYDRRREIAQKA